MDIQVELGEKLTEYQPYQEQTLTITSDRPITKWDRLVEQGGQIGWLYAGVVIDRFDGQSNKISIANKQGNVQNFSIRFENVANGNGNSDIFVDKYRAVQLSYTKAEYGICCNWNDGVKYFSAPNENVATVDEFKAWLIENPLKIAYETTNPEFVPLPQSEQDAVRNLKTYYPTTVIMVDGGDVDAGIEVEYAVENMNTNFGKLEDGILIYAPSVLRVGDKQIISPDKDDYLNSGYLPIVTGDDLEYKEGFEIVTSYKVVEESQAPDGEMIPKHILRVQEYQEIFETPYIPTKNDLAMELMMVRIPEEINTYNLTNDEAIRYKSLHPTFSEIVGQTVKRGFRFVYENELYSVNQDNLTIQEQHSPGTGTESLYEIVDEEHSGTKDDPIPWRKNMQCYKDKYYIQNEIVYKCTRDSGNALQNDIIDLIGHYFEVA